MGTPRRLLTALLSVGVLVTTAGCGGTGTDTVDPQEALSAARTTLDETTGVHLSLRTDQLPEGVDGLKSATGTGAHPPAFKGVVGLEVDNLSLDVPVVAIGRTVFAKLPFTVKYSEVDPTEYGAPNPAMLMDPEKGLSAWLTAAQDVTAGDPVREGDLVLTPYSGTLPGRVVADTIPSADPTGEFPVTFSLADDETLRSVEVSGPFYGDRGEVDYTVDFTDYGTNADIRRP